MRFMTVREMRSGSRELWTQLKNDDEVILTSNGKPVAILAGVSEKNLEQLLKAFRRAKAMMAVEEMQQAALRTGVGKMTVQEIEAEIKAARRERRK
jgi:antitoxin (DNA-binding transcriptional repressor) of toxin-antitoxin stability system